MIKLLVVDDNQDILELVDCIYSDHPEIETIMANSGKEAESILKESGAKIDIILSDYEMPDGDGGYLYKVNEKYKKPFIFHSSSLDYNLKHINESESFKTFYFEKPADFDEITDCINKISEGFLIFEEKYYPLSPTIILRYIKVFKEIYIKVNDKFLLICSEDRLNIDFVLKHIKMGKVKTFYVKSNELKKISENVVKGYKEDVEVGDFLEVLTTSYELAEFGNKEFENATILLMDVYNNFKDDFKDLISRFSKQGNFVIAHSLIASHLSMLLLSRLRLDNKRLCQSFLHAYIIHNTKMDEDEIYKEKFHHQIKELSFNEIKDFKVRELISKHHLVGNIEFKKCSVEQKVFNFCHLASIHLLDKNNKYPSIIGFTLSKSYYDSCRSFIENIINRS